MPPNNRIKDEKTGSGVSESRPEDGCHLSRLPGGKFQTRPVPWGTLSRPN